MYYIYKYTNIHNGKEYVGLTNNLRRRHNSHKNTPGCSAFHSAVKKYGIDSFIRTILYETEISEGIEEKESFFIDQLNTISPNGYNLRTQSEYGGVSEDTRRKIKEGNIGKHNKGKAIWSLESKLKKRESMMGEKNPFYNKRHSNESIQIMKEKKTGENHPFFGRKHSQTTLQKMREVQQKRRLQEKLIASSAGG